LAYSVRSDLVFKRSVALNRRWRNSKPEPALRREIYSDTGRGQFER